MVDVLQRGTLSVLVIMTLGCHKSIKTPRAATSVQVTWTASVTPSVTYNVYRAALSCTSATSFSKLNTSPINTTSYTDSTVAPGTYCYYATSFLSPQESVPSNKGEATIIAPPTNFSVTPPTATLKLNEQQQFAVTPNNSNIRWSVIGEGTVTNTGLYTAPSSIQGNNIDVQVVASNSESTSTAIVTLKKK